MDVNEIKKIASRKKIKTEVEKVREKVSQQIAQIIKVKVEQDTTYWDVREKLQQTENNTERLKQNMVEVQMQYESISSQYQDELRLRPQLLNKLNSNREMLNVLETYITKLKETLTRCRADQVNLYEAYQKLGEHVQELTSRKKHDDEINKKVIEELHEKVALANGQQNQLIQFLTAAKQQADSELVDLKAELAMAHAKKEEMYNAIGEMTRNLENYKHDVEKKTEWAIKMQEEMEKITNELRHVKENARIAIEKKEKELNDVSDERNSLKQALHNQELCTKSVLDQKDVVEEKFAAAEEKIQDLVAAIDSLSMKLSDANMANQNHKNNLSNLVQEKEGLQKELQNCKQLLTNTEETVHSLQMQVSALQKDNSDILIELDHVKKDCDDKNRKIEELLAAEGKLKEKCIELENALEAHREITANQIKDMQNQINNKDLDIETKGKTISQLMSQVETDENVKTQLEENVQKLMVELKNEREAGQAKERTLNVIVEQLEISVKDKEAELSNQLSIILEIKKEKDRLQQKIQEMQNKIDNVQKELTGRPHPPPLEQAEMDDNAVMMAPFPKETKNDKSPIAKEKTHFAMPRPSKQPDVNFFDFFSDTSEESDALLSKKEVGRRFDALSRNENIPPVSLNVLKRRRTSGGPRRPAANAPISLSQVKDNIMNKQRNFFKHKRLNEKGTPMK